MPVMVQREIRKRGFFGKLIKLLFIVFNILMALWLVSYWATAGGMLNQMASDAERTGGAIGATLATSMILSMWAAGATILGILTLLTRGPRILVTEERP